MLAGFPLLFVCASNGYNGIVLNTYTLVIVVFDNLKAIGNAT